MYELTDILETGNIWDGKRYERNHRERRVNMSSLYPQDSLEFYAGNPKTTTSIT